MDSRTVTTTGNGTGGSYNYEQHEYDGSTAVWALVPFQPTSKIFNVKELNEKLTPVKQPLAFDISADALGSKPNVDVKGPKGKSVPVQVSEVDRATYRVEFTPEIVGDHIVHVNYANVPIQGSPFKCRVYDSQKIKVGEIQKGHVGQPAHFIVDASEAGVGDLEVSVNDGRIPSMAHSLGQHRYDISFVPKHTLDHTISIRFNNEHVHGSPFVCKMVPPLSHQASATGPGLERIPIKKLTFFTVDAQGASQAQPIVTIKDQTGQDLKPKISGSSEKGYRIEYTPEIVGKHQIDVKLNNQPINGSPFVAKVYDSTKVKLFLVEGKLMDKPCHFYIDAAEAGVGNMEIIVSVDNRNVPNFVQAEGNAKFKVCFNPTESKPHVISVKFNEEPVPGSPMTCPILGSPNSAYTERSPNRPNGRCAVM